MNDFEYYISYSRGNFPVIISIPHGGEYLLNSIPTRNNGILGIDKNTIEIGLMLAQRFKELSQMGTKVICEPSIIISKIHRSKIDFNREKDQAYEASSALASKFYLFYHNKLLQFIHSNLNLYGTSFLIDIHGFEKSKRPAGYREVDLVIGTNNLKSLFPVEPPKRLWGKNIRGKLINNLLAQSILIAPSHRLRREYILTGGYITQKFGASEITGSHSMQLELSDDVRLKNENLRIKIVDTIASTLLEKYGRLN
jgi:N-formylglutamate amidohydrolase